jgi:GGDEF domain-containing protein
LAAAVSQIGALPVLEGTVQRVLALCRDEDSSTRELTSVLESDPEFAANLLRFANSAYASRPIRVRTIRQAVTMTGRAAIGRLAVRVRHLPLPRARARQRPRLCRLDAHPCLRGRRLRARARASQRQRARARAPRRPAARHRQARDADRAFGEPIMDEIASQATAGPARVQLERERLGCDHALAGAVLARASHLDEPVVAAIGAHHDPLTDATREIACVQLANAIVGMLAGIDPDPPLIDRALTALELEAAVLDEVAAHAAPRAGTSPAPQGGADGLAARVAALEEQAGSDELTGLANRRRWKREARERILRDGGAVMICDIDHFKQINDRSGHMTGDLVLSEIARILSHHGFAGRLGGDELVLLATATSPRRRNGPGRANTLPRPRNIPTRQHPRMERRAVDRHRDRHHQPARAQHAPRSRRRRALRSQTPRPRPLRPRPLDPLTSARPTPQPPHCSPAGRTMASLARSRATPTLTDHAPAGA